MASDNIRQPISVNASADLSTKQFYFMKLDTSGLLATQASSGASCVGILQDKPNAAGQPGQICGPGDVTKVVAGAGVTSGQFVMSDGNGKCVAATSGSYVMGQALDSASSADIFRIRYQPQGKL